MRFEFVILSGDSTGHHQVVSSAVQYRASVLESAHQTRCILVRFIQTVLGGSSARYSLVVCMCIVIVLNADGIIILCTSEILKILISILTRHIDQVTQSSNVVRRVRRVRMRIRLAYARSVAIARRNA